MWKEHKRDILLFAAGILFGLFLAWTVVVWGNITADREEMLVLLGTVAGAALALLIGIIFYILTRIDIDNSKAEMLKGLDNANQKIVIKTLGDAILKSSGVLAPHIVDFMVEATKKTPPTNVKAQKTPAPATQSSPKAVGG